MFVQAPFFFKPKSPCHFFWYLLKGLLKSHSFVVYSFVVYSFVVLCIQWTTYTVLFQNKKLLWIRRFVYSGLPLSQHSQMHNSYLSYCNRMWL